MVVKKKYPPEHFGNREFMYSYFMFSTNSSVRLEVEEDYVARLSVAEESRGNCEDRLPLNLGVSQCDLSIELEILEDESLRKL